MGENAYRDKIRSIGAPRRLGQSERRPVRNEETGGQAGVEVKHWDGRQDAIATVAAPVVWAPLKREEG